MQNDMKRVPTMSTRVDLPSYLWEEIDDVSRLDRVPKAQMFREGLRLWLDRHEEEKTA